MKLLKLFRIWKFKRRLVGVDDSKETIPKVISDSEYLVRIILHHYHYSESKDKIRDEALEPRKNENNRASVNRYAYTTPSFCKESGLKMAENRTTEKETIRFIGLGLVKVGFLSSLPTINEKDKEEVLNQLEGVKVDVEFSPYEDNPSHSDIVYCIPNWTPEHNPIKSVFKKRVLKPLAKELNKNFFKDKDPSSNEWSGDEISINSISE